MFFLLLMVYGVVPNQWMRWADNELKWRADKLGIPLGPLGHFLHNQFGIGNKNNVIAPNGIKFGGRGKIVISAKILEDIVATVIYGIAPGRPDRACGCGGRLGASGPRPAGDRGAVGLRPAAGARNVKGR